jgi:hypothetical protein
MDRNEIQRVYAQRARVISFEIAAARRARRQVDEDLLESMRATRREIERLLSRGSTERASGE